MVFPPALFVATVISQNDVGKSHDFFVAPRHRSGRRDPEAQPLNSPFRISRPKTKARRPYELHHQYVRV
jgi:hypothetical protein